MRLVLDYLEEATLKNKNKIAVIEEEKKITYEELLFHSKKIGSYLLDFVKMNEPVIVFMDKGIETLEIFFGILYAGGCYSLINPELPASRLKLTNEVLKSKVVITNEENYLKAKENYGELTVLKIDEILRGIAEINEEGLNKVREAKIDLDPVYINFTSGSTGVPKGVVVGNRSILDFIDIFTKEFHFNEKDLIANQAPFDFDVSVKDIYSALCVGATLVIVPKKLFSSPAALLDYLVDNKVTTMTWAVSALCLITTFHGLDYKVPTTVKKILFSGEVMPIKHLKMWMDKLPEAEFINVYGPTEITCNCTYYRIKRDVEYIELPIGKPFKNERILLLDGDDKEVKEMETPGEICVAGTCLALGYYSNEEQTNKAFVRNPLNKNYIEYIYRTGDLGKYNKDGDLIFVGRKDFQIKYQGHRIELEEIDRQVMGVEAVRRVCTVFYEKKNKLYCFYVGEATKEEIVEYLHKNVPEYMVPSKFKQIDNFVLNKNGKIDRKVLIAMIEEGI